MRTLASACEEHVRVGAGAEGEGADPVLVAVKFVALGAKLLRLRVPRPQAQRGVGAAHGEQRRVGVAGSEAEGEALGLARLERHRLDLGGV